MLNPISTITVESALIPATSEPESASPDLFQSLIADLLAPTTVAPDTPSAPLSVPPEREISVKAVGQETEWLSRVDHPPTAATALRDEEIPLLGKGGVDATSERYREASLERSGRGSWFKQPPNNSPRFELAAACVPTSDELASSTPVEVPTGNNRWLETTTPSAPQRSGAIFFMAQPPLLREGGESAIAEPDAGVQDSVPQIRPTPQIVPEFPEIVSTSEVVLYPEPPRETKASTPPAFVTLVASIPDGMLNQIQVPVYAHVERADSDLRQAVGAVYDCPRPLTEPATEMMSINIETEALPAPVRWPIEHVATPVRSETVLSEPALKRPAPAMTPPNDLPSPPPVTPESLKEIATQRETLVRDSQVDGKPIVQTSQTHPALVQPLLQPEVSTARQLVQPQPIAITADAPATVPAVIGASPHFMQNGSEEKKQDFRNENGRAAILETHSTTPHVETTLRFQSHLMPMESAAPAAHVVELPPQLPSPVAHRVSIDIGEKDSRVVVTLHENRGDVSLRIHTPNEVLGAELRSSVGTLVEAFQREHIPLANMDFTTGYAATPDGGQQHANQPRQSFQNRARKFELPVEPTDQVEITSINLNA